MLRFPGSLLMSEPAFGACFSAGYVKGWKRAVMLLITAHGVKELGLGDHIPHSIKVPSLRFGH